MISEFGYMLTTAAICIQECSFVFCDLKLHAFTRCDNQSMVQHHSSSSCHSTNSPHEPDDVDQVGPLGSYTNSSGFHQDTDTNMVAGPAL